MATVVPLHPGDELVPPRERSLRPPLPRPNAIAVTAVLLGLLGFGIYCIADLKINLATMIDSLGLAQKFLQRCLPLDFDDPGEIVAATVQTLMIVVAATTLAVVLSIPVALAAAAPTTRGPVSRGIARTLIVVCRAIPDLVFAVVFLRIFGLGPMGGIWAMAIHSVGMIGKLYADAIEQLDDGPNEALRAAGASKKQWIRASVLMRLMPQLIATALHRFDINLRASVILGYVGVGGIGLLLSNALRSLRYQRGMAIALIVLALCIAFEMVSGAIRGALLRQDSTRQRRSVWDRLSGGWFSGGRRGAAAQPGRLSPPWDVARTSRWLGILVTAVIVAASFAMTFIDPAAFAQAAHGHPEALVEWVTKIPSTLSLFWPPSDGGLGWAKLLEELGTTIKIAFAATMLGALLAVPLGVLAARNVIRNPAIHTIFRVIIVVVRGIPELILAIIFVVITGLGATAGASALAIGALGLLAKLVADSLEETDVDVQTAVRATGASPAQVFWSATVRQAAPQFVAHVLYQLDVNLRSATLLGIVGAGGIGFYLLNATRVLELGVVTSIVGLILVTVLAVEALAIWIRRSVA